MEETEVPKKYRSQLQMVIEFIL